MGLLWTVAQTGSADTSAHLCEFARHFSSDVPTDCHAADWIASAAGWLFIFAVVVVLGDVAWMIATWKGWSRRKPVGAEFASLPALEIHFDSTNPARRFWSFESPRDPDGKALPGIVYEYRVAIHNSTARTFRNVSVTVESLGQAGFRPMPAAFDKGRRRASTSIPAAQNWCPCCAGLTRRCSPVCWPTRRHWWVMARSPSRRAATTWRPSLAGSGSIGSANRCCSISLSPERRSVRGRRSRFYEGGVGSVSRGAGMGRGGGRDADVSPLGQGHRARPRGLRSFAPHLHLRSIQGRSRTESNQSFGSTLHRQGFCT